VAILGPCRHQCEFPKDLIPDANFAHDVVVNLRVEATLLGNLRRCVLSLILSDLEMSFTAPFWLDFLLCF